VRSAGSAENGTRRHRVHTAPLVSGRAYSGAYVCGNWAIAYQMRGLDEMLIDEIGRASARVV